MATKYFCDVCTMEIDKGGHVYLMGNSSSELRVLCLNCWRLAESTLLKFAKTISLKTEC